MFSSGGCLLVGCIEPSRTTLDITHLRLTRSRFASYALRLVSVFRYVRDLFIGNEICILRTPSINGRSDFFCKLKATTFSRSLGFSKKTQNCMQSFWQREHIYKNRLSNYQIWKDALQLIERIQEIFLKIYLFGISKNSLCECV